MRFLNEKSYQTSGVRCQKKKDKTEVRGEELGVNKFTIYNLQFTIRITLFLICGFCTIQAMAQSERDSLHPIELKGVGVTWKSPSGEEQFSATNIDKTEIQQNAGNGSINNLFNMVPSMITTSDAGTGLGYTYMRIRGIDQTRINVTINGIALNDAESQGSWFVNVPDFGSKVERLEVQRGVGTSNNGPAAFGATMDFTTLSNERPRYAEFSSSFGSFRTFRNAITVGTGLLGDCFAATLSYSNILSDGYIDYASARLNNVFFSSDLYLKNKKKNKDYGKLQLNIMYGNEKTGLAWNGVPSDSLATNRRYNSCGEYYDAEGRRHHYSNETDNYQQLHNQLFYDYGKWIHSNHYLKVNAGAHLTRGIGYYEEYQDDRYYSSLGLPEPIIGDDTLYYNDFITRKYLDNYFYGVVFSIKESFLNLGKSADNEKTEHMLSWSVGGALNHYDGKEYGTLEWADIVGITEHQHWYDGTGKKTQFNIYGTVEYTGKRWYAYVDLQYRLVDHRIGGTDEHLQDITQNHLWHFFNPKIGASVNVDEGKHHSLYTSLARSNREPTRADLIAGVNNQEPVPETLYDWELGYRMQYKNYTLNVNGYAMYYDNQLVLTGQINEVGASIMTNVKKSYRIGIELVSAYRVCKWFYWNVKGTFSSNKILDYTEYVDDWDMGEQRVNKLGKTDISFSPAIVASNEFLFTPVKNFNISLNTQYVSRQYIGNSSNNTYSIKPYCVSNLQLSYCLHTRAVKDIEFTFQVNNLFNAKYESNAWIYRYYVDGRECSMDGYFPQATINFLGGVRVKL